MSADEELLAIGPGLLVAVVLTTELVSTWRGAERERAWINGVWALLSTITLAIVAFYSVGSDMISVGVGLSAPLVGLAFSAVAAAQGVRLARWGAGLFSLSGLVLLWQCYVVLHTFGGAMDEALRR